MRSGALIAIEDLVVPGLFEEPLSLALEAGERVLVAGPSGSGKSTFMRCVAGLDPRARGRWFLRGQSVDDEQLPAYRAEVCYLAQTPARSSQLLVEYLARPFAFRAQGRRDLRFDKGRCRTRLEDLGLSPEAMERKVSTLSGGEMQRAALARALLLDVRVLLLDEVSAGLDSESTARVCDALEAWIERCEGAILYSSHDEAFIERIGGTEHTMTLGLSRGEGR